MSEIYKKLAKQATTYCIHLGESLPWVWEEKFAELVVKECLKVATDYEYNEDADPQYEIVYRIKEHFGVK